MNNSVQVPAFLSQLSTSNLSERTPGFFEQPAIEITVLVIKCCLLVLAIFANLGVVLTVFFHENCPRKHAALAATSLCISNIFYGLFVLLYATPIRHSQWFLAPIRSSPIACHISQVGSNAPKTWIIAHHVWIAVDTFWLIKRPFEYSTLIAKYFNVICYIVWIGLTLFEIIFQTVTLCFYETFFIGKYGPNNLPPSKAPELTGILVNFMLYFSAFLVVSVLYFQVFKEALNRTRGGNGGKLALGGKRVERESLTSSTVAECDDETYKKELRLLYGFVALLTGTIFFIVFRNVYYGVCLYITCSSGSSKEFLISTTTSLGLSFLVLMAPYTYFYRNPLFWKCFLKFLAKCFPKLATKFSSVRQATSYYTQTTGALQPTESKKQNKPKNDETKT